MSNTFLTHDFGLRPKGANEIEGQKGARGSGAAGPRKRKSLPQIKTLFINQLNIKKIWKQKRNKQGRGRQRMAKLK